MKKNKVVEVDLGIIKVRTIGKRDVVILAHNRLRAFSVVCGEGARSTVTRSRKFSAYPRATQNECMIAYWAWKRPQLPEMQKLHAHGKTKDGHEHPWHAPRSRKLRNAQHRISSEADPDSDEAGPPPAV